MSVYGGPEYLPVDETHPVDPKTYYAAGKLGAEAYVKLFDNLGLDTTIFRLFSVYGPGQNMRNMKQGMVSIYLSFVLRGEELLIKGPTERFRDFVYVDDVVDAWIKATNAPETHGETYNICRNKRIEVSELVDTMLDVYGAEDYPIEITDGTPGDQFGIYGNASKLRDDLGWSPTVSLESGLKRMIENEKESL
jgi:UDP-glucose 4-epimerase